jgi:hypothetical protein
MAKKSKRAKKEKKAVTKAAVKKAAKKVLKQGGKVKNIKRRRSERLSRETAS